MITTAVTTAAAASMEPPPTNIAAPVTCKVLRDMWVYDVCRIVSFENFDDTCRHKKEFL